MNNEAGALPTKSSGKEKSSVSKLTELLTLHPYRMADYASAIR
jgi:hypothetical protein